MANSPKSMSPLNRLVLRGVLLALSFILSAIDHSLPSFLPGVPPMSIGLANLVVLFSLIFLNAKDALIITLAKSIFVFFLRGPISFLLSLSGGLLALLIEVLIWVLPKKKISIYFLSAIGGIFHNVGQILAYSFYAKLNVWVLMIPLALVGLVTGILIAFILNLLTPLMDRWFKNRRKDFG